MFSENEQKIIINALYKNKDYKTANLFNNKVKEYEECYKKRSYVFRRASSPENPKKEYTKTESNMIIRNALLKAGNYADAQLFI